MEPDHWVMRLIVLVLGQNMVNYQWDTQLGALCLDRCVICLRQRYAALFRDGHAIPHPQTIWRYLKEKPNRAPRRPSPLRGSRTTSCAN